MPNPLFNMMNKNSARPDMRSQFRNFMGQMRGGNPDEMLNELISSGKISQAHLNQAQNQAQQIQSQFDSMKNMFGF